MVLVTTGMLQRVGGFRYSSILINPAKYKPKKPPD